MTLSNCLDEFTPDKPLSNLPFVLLAGPDVIEHDGSVNLDSAYQLKDITDRLKQNYNIEYYFKSSYDKANRTSVSAYRGPGIEKGLEILNNIRTQVGVPVITDVHSPEEAVLAGQVVDIIQIPAFLSRQTDLLLAAGKTGKIINLKKGQFLSPHDIRHAAEKIKSTGNSKILITERGSTFGYNNLVVDMRCIPIVQSHGYPLIFDATHSIQLPGGGNGCSGGERQYATTLARAAVAAGCNGLFFETHPTPESALCDGPNMIPLSWMEELLTNCLEIHAIVKKSPNFTLQTV